MTKPQERRVALVEDDRRYRTALRQTLSREPGFRVVADFGSGEALLRSIDRPLASPPFELVLMDIDLPGLNGIEVTRQLTARWPIDVVMLTVFEDPGRIVEAICAGAHGYALKRSSAPDLLRQLRTLSRGGAVLTGEVAKLVLDIVKRQSAVGRPLDPEVRLTERERDILRCLVEGRTYLEIGEQLGISIHTVRTHLRKVYRKLQVNSATEAVARAIREGLT
ncbi:MAG: response regulator transcription factor [Myxococcota bacterium]